MGGGRPHAFKIHEAGNRERNADPLQVVFVLKLSTLHRDG